MDPLVDLKSFVVAHTVNIKDMHSMMTESETNEDKRIAWAAGKNYLASAEAAKVTMVERMWDSDLHVFSLT